MPKELPIFSCNPDEWPLFMSTFAWSTSVSGQYTKVSTTYFFASILYTGININFKTFVWSTRENTRYKIKSSLPVVNTNRLKSITTFAVSGLYEELNNSSLLQEIILKLSPDLQLSWAMFKAKLMKENKKQIFQYLLTGFLTSVYLPTNIIPPTTTEQIPQNKERDAHIQRESKESVHYKNNYVNKLLLFLFKNVFIKLFQKIKPKGIIQNFLI